MSNGTENIVMFRSLEYCDGSNINESLALALASRVQPPNLTYTRHCEVCTALYETTQNKSSRNSSARDVHGKLNRRIIRARCKSEGVNEQAHTSYRSYITSNSYSRCIVIADDDDDDDD